jgi:hypothetical protein
MGVIELEYTSFIAPKEKNERDRLIEIYKSPDKLN